MGATLFPRGLMLTPDAAIDWDAPSLAALTESDFDALLALDPKPEFVLLGSGPTLARPSPSLATALEAKGVGVEVMDSRAAARAWGLLRGEGRHIAAALLPFA
ncbi:MTH938/NDUFAF3 family protein [Sphingomonas nostoxanthinifaciens]|uniref:MTH938/NDUFAF3 family protein n=1 Tax=Sphingomonas nostoxanthinifaciens TaxID=2872652 RepID=UPI002953BAC1|nr:MTH938/NDUFAF3 family protein [Sphingomonas nostoxanthinifaciens]